MADVLAALEPLSALARAERAGATVGSGPLRRAVQDALLATQHIYFDDEVMSRWGQGMSAA